MAHDELQRRLHAHGANLAVRPRGFADPTATPAAVAVAVAVALARAVRDALCPRR